MHCCHCLFYLIFKVFFEARPRYLIKTCISLQCFHCLLFYLIFRVFYEARPRYLKMRLSRSALRLIYTSFSGQSEWLKWSVVGPSASMIAEKSSGKCLSLGVTVTNYQLQIIKLVFMLSTKGHLNLFIFIKIFNKFNNRPGRYSNRGYLYLKRRSRLESDALTTEIPCNTD